jgi:hypothetical protein
MLGQIDPAVLSRVLGSITADQLVDLIEQGGGQDSVIVGREGREFVNTLWEHVAVKLQALASAPPQG